MIARRGAVFGSLASFLFPPPPPPRPLFSFSLSFALYASRSVATLAATPLEPHGAHTRDDYPVQFLWYRTAMTEKRASMPFAAVRTVKLICGRPDGGMCACVCKEALEGARSHGVSAFRCRVVGGKQPKIFVFFFPKRVIALRWVFRFCAEILRRVRFAACRTPGRSMADGL